jgi:hypothetical protein
MEVGQPMSDRRRRLASHMDGEDVNGRSETRSRRAAGLRRRVVLRPVEPHEARGFVIPLRRSGSIPFRGRGADDYACGGCGGLIAIGVDLAAFENFVFACGCGALNELP